MLKEIAKALLLRTLRPAAAQRILMAHYLRVLTTFPEGEEPDLEVVRCLVAKGDYVVDIGANIGVYTKYLSAYVGPQGCVYSIEPVGRTFDILRANVEALGLHNVRLLRSAISGSEGSVTMEVPRGQFGAANLYESKVVAAPRRRRNSEVVAATTIDSLFAQSPSPIRFIKCDVEGHEFPCISEATRVIRQHAPAWLIEVSGNPDDDQSCASSLMRMLRQFGYEAHWLCGHELRLRRSGDRSVNYFFLLPHHVELLRDRGFACP